MHAGWVSRHYERMAEARCGAVYTRLYSVRHQRPSCPQRLELKALRLFGHVRQKTTTRTAAFNTIFTNRDAVKGPTHQSPRRRMAPKAPKACNPKHGKKRSDID